jgi:hypothetical protein
MIMVSSSHPATRRVRKHDESNDKIKRTKRESKKALKKKFESNDEFVDATAISPSIKKEYDNDDVVVASTIATAITSPITSCEHQTKDDCDGRNNAPPHITNPPTKEKDDGIIKELERAYQIALAEYKGNKTNKDLRRAKTAARRELDNALLLLAAAAAAAAAAGGDDVVEQLTCTNCSKKFIFTTKERTKYEQMGWTDKPKRCPNCRVERMTLTVEQRNKLDTRDKNKCYAFQRGECLRGINCKFSHNPEYGGVKTHVRTET